MRRLILILLLALTACDNESASSKFADLTPAKCREFGVGVQDGTAMSGIIGQQNGRPMSEPLLASTFNRLEKECGGDWHTIYGGCSIPTEMGHYNIWYADSQCISYHEACHAMANSRHHTGDFNARSLTGEWLAACPK